ncbi:MAG: ATP phosphoribosyltransferase regulatory subunit [Gammaproteobacteria bacterium]|nr:ATP phosphoribosyltransferase regulatory subunit [Gammaproteobacteria bacterium]
MAEFPPGDDYWLLPEGVEETLPLQAEHLETLRRRLLDLFYSWGYELVAPPLIEYLDSLLTGTGKDLELRTFTLVDQLSGRMLGVRADMTPQVARIDAHHLKSDVPVRLCYLGEVLHTRPDSAMATRSPLQVGAELFGHDGVESDAEILRLMVATLCAAGLDRIHIDLGHVGIFRSLARAAQLSDVQEKILFEALQRKAIPEIERFLDALPIDDALSEMLAGLANLNGGKVVLEQARSLLKEADASVHDALDSLQQIAAIMRDSAPGVTLHFDLAELRGYRYQTGLVFAAFVPGHGQEIARGGRYNQIGKVFGRARPATGFSTDLKTLVALSPSEAVHSMMIFAPAVDDAALHKVIQQLREQGERVVVELPGQVDGHQQMRCNRMLVQSDQGWQVKPFG